MFEFHAYVFLKCITSTTFAKFMTTYMKAQNAKRDKDVKLSDELVKYRIWSMLWARSISEFPM